MKITTLIGWSGVTPSGRPEGAPTVISCVDTDGAERIAQGKLWTDAKSLHQYPDGIRCMAFICSESYELAIQVTQPAPTNRPTHKKSKSTIP